MPSQLKKKVRFLPLLVIVSLLISCSRSEQYTIGVSLYGVYSWRLKLLQEISLEARIRGDVRLVVEDADNDVASQVRQIRRLAKKNPDLLIISPYYDDQVKQVIEEVYDSGIPILLVDGRKLTDKYTAFLGADNYEIGVSVGSYVAELLGGRGRILEIQGKEGDSTSIMRHEGFLSACSRYPHMRVVASPYGQYLDSVADGQFNQFINNNEKPDLVFLHSDGMWNEEFKTYALNPDDPVRFVGIDALSAEPSAINLIKNFGMTASFEYPTRGDRVFRLAIDILERRPFQRTQVLPTGVMDEHNVEIISSQKVSLDEYSARIYAQQTYLSSLSERFHLIQMLLVVLFVLLLGFVAATYMIYKTSRRNLKLREDMEEQAGRLVETNASLEQLNHRISHDAEQKLSFFTNISHEIRTPVTLIATPIQQLESNPDLSGAQRQKLLHIAGRNTDRLLHLVNDILDYRKISDGSMTPKPEWFDMAELLRSHLPLFSLEAEKGCINIRSVGIETNVLKIHADRKMVSSIFFNLMSNALKYTPQGGTITVELSEGADKIFTLTVTDTGEGISPEARPHIFDSFYQSPDASGGTGIGLALVKTYAELHGGSVTVEDVPSGGACFAVVIPLNPFPKPSEEDQKEPESKVNILDEHRVTHDVPSRGELPKILIIDDNDEVCDVFISLFSHEYDILTASNGKAGYDLALELVPDAIVCDVMMPVMDGLALLQKLKTTLATCHIPVILLTARTLDQQRIEGLDQGADAYIAKPFSADHLRAQINNLLRNRRMLRDLFEGKAQAESTPVMNPRDVDFLNKFKEYIEEHLEEADFNVESLSEKMFLSRSQLYLKVKALTGMSPIEHLRSARMKRAHHLLLTTGLSISEIAYSVGFTLPNHFSKIFHQEYGITPSQLRKGSSN